MSTPVRDEPPAAVPEELVLGPGSTRPLPRWLPITAGALVLLLVGAAVAWHVWPRPVAPLSLTDLQNTYAGIVRADGTNDASVMTRQTVAETRVTVTPADCTPLVQATVANRFPDRSLDGVGTYWIGQTSTISLFTLRFPDAAAARAEEARIAAALDVCADQQIYVRSSQDDRVSAWQATVTRTPAGSPEDDQLGYVLSSSDERMAMQLLPYQNTLTWQYRYETASGAYAPLAADQLMYSLRVQLDAIVAARPR